MDIEIVDLPYKNGDFPQLCKRLPEGNAYSGSAFQHVSMATTIGQFTHEPGNGITGRFQRTPIANLRYLTIKKDFHTIIDVLNIYIYNNKQNAHNHRCSHLHIQVAYQNIYIYTSYPTYPNVQQTKQSPQALIQGFSTV